MPAKTSQLYIGDGEYVEKTSREITLTSEVKAKIDNIPAVVNSFDSVSTTDALSAAAGKQLKDLVDSVGTIGKYLSAWDCATGLPVTDPIDNPHLYKVGDYYVISNVAASSGTNYRPDSVKYEHGVASTAVETGTPALNDSYYYDGVQWILQPSGGRTIVIDSSLSSTSTNPVENRIINSALNGKQATISDLATIRSGAALGATAIQPGANISTLTNNSGFVTSGTVDSKIATATANFQTGSQVDTKIATATADFVTSNEVDTQIGTALTTGNYTTATDVNSAISTATQGMVTETSLATKGYQTQGEVNAAISNATLHMAETGDNITEFVNNAGYQTASQVSNTVNTAVAGKQDTLVSGTNIKTVNNISILGSGNIDIQGGGNNKIFDAIVASDGTGDYTDVKAALSDGKARIFVKNGTYTHTDEYWNASSTSLGDVLIQGESTKGVIVNFNSTTGVSSSDRSFIRMRCSGSSSHAFVMKNITFNIAPAGGTTSGSGCFNCVFGNNSNSIDDDDDTDSLFRVEDCRFNFNTTNGGACLANGFKIKDNRAGINQTQERYGLYRCTIFVSGTYNFGMSCQPYNYTFYPFIFCDGYIESRAPVTGIHGLEFHNSVIDANDVGMTSLKLKSSKIQCDNIYPQFSSDTSSKIIITEAIFSDISISTNVTSFSEIQLEHIVSSDIFVGCDTNSVNISQRDGSWVDSSIRAYDNNSSVELVGSVSNCDIECNHITVRMSFAGGIVGSRLGDVTSGVHTLEDNTISGCVLVGDWTIIGGSTYSYDGGCITGCKCSGAGQEITLDGDACVFSGNTQFNTKVILGANAYRCTVSGNTINSFSTVSGNSGCTVVGNTIIATSTHTGTNLVYANNND